MTDTTAGTGVSGNTPSAEQAADQQQTTAERNKLKPVLATKYVPYFVWPALVIILLFVVNWYEWSFFWILIAGVSLLFAANISRKKASDKDWESPHKSLILTVANQMRLLAIVLIIFTVLNSSFVLWVGETVNAAEGCIGGDQRACQELTRSEPTPSVVITVTPAVWQTATAPAYGQNAGRIDIGFNLFCADDNGATVTYHDVGTSSAHARISAPGNRPIEVQFLLGSRAEVRATAPTC